MTQEEKAKAYDKVREKIALRFGSNVAEEIFSQFEMSEDERIRKALINGFNKLDKSAVWYNGITNGQILAWLERQEKNSMGISEATKQELEDNLNKALEKETPESCNEFLDEQKPADKIEPSIFKDRLLELFQIFRWRCKDHILTNGEILEYVDAHIQELIGTMQKPADTEKGAKGNDREIPNSAWSEEDEARFESCIDVLQTSDGYDTINAKWLKSLKERVQPLPKQEWGEEDESEIDILCHFLEEYGERYYGYIPLQNTISWLKSLRERYTWKPSDEQMKMLDEVLNFAANHESPYWNDCIFGILNNLIKQLKKLMEE